MKDLEGRVAIITGAASGIGRGTAIAMGRAGIRVVVTDINEAGARAVADDIGANAVAQVCDVGQLADFERARDTALATFGRVDIVMNNAGILTSGLPEDLPFDEWMRVLDSNLLSIVRSNQVFLPLFLEKGEGHIVNTASFAGLMTYSYDRLPYSAAKAGVVQLSEGLAIYLKPKGIGVTCLCPGPVRTNIMTTIKQRYSEGLDIRGPGPQFDLIEPEAAGEMVVNAIRNDIFMLPTHPQVRELLIERASDWDAFIQRQIDSPHIIVPRQK
ncbi:MAG: SDR family oxidoreductase [Porticoccaceae bacterium]|jgi:NAD(P)-dependent dehydrogenase (short-subunit alcohol dehydrogenase family)|nr:SDR family oxidoreductase [Porticoccaceae bacterium]MEA3300198.1 SDR family oxidoreductase [Pseudomonadota bacterium]HLS97906.1 SDR family oxidoreductase [Porticoccaceae bacterium]